jgi:hypothetical protein
MESHFGGFPLQVVDLQLAVLSLIELGSFVHELHAVAQHPVDQTGQLGRHSFNRNRSTELGSESAKLCPRYVLLTRKVLAAILKALVADCWSAVALCQ